MAGTVSTSGLALLAAPSFAQPQSAPTRKFLLDPSPPPTVLDPPRLPNCARALQLCFVVCFDILFFLSLP